MKKNIHILLVDDDVETRTLYAEFLRPAGFEVREAKDGLEGLEMINQIPPDVIITGIILPRLDGFGLVENLKKNVATSSIPVIFLSHLGREEDERRAKELGVKDFIVRDMTSPNEVIRRIHAVFETTEYLIAFDQLSLDARRLAQDLQMNWGALCVNKEDGQVALKLRVRDKEKKLFDAEFTCV